mmetsp:Transcript_38397/g.105932  ORF Transcript_38397/g.105932 Transcript_38397/m.105932 type:complete len:216 (+) Transcript_38397:128-775(+)
MWLQILAPRPCRPNTTRSPHPACALHEVWFPLSPMQNRPAHARTPQSPNLHPIESSRHPTVLRRPQLLILLPKLHNLLLELAHIRRDQRVSPAQLPRSRPQVHHFAPEADAHEQIGELNACAKQSSELENAKTAAKPAQHCGLKGHLVATIRDANAKEHRMRLSGHTVDILLERRVHSVVSWRERLFSLDEPGHGQRVADRTEASDRVQREGDRW